MPKRKDLHKILVIGSGPIVIGQAAEFDYSGSQACLALKEEGYEVVLVNSNPATIMTDEEVADRVYMEPLTKDFLTKIIRREEPDAILPTLGGQTGLNLAKELADSKLLQAMNIELLGTKLQAIEQAEDRQLFKDLMNELGEPVPESAIAESLDEVKSIAQKIGFPLVVRPAYTLGGSGGGFVHDEEELQAIAAHGLDLSPVNQVLIEQSIAGFKEIEFEVMRDRADNALIVASMENVDPVGIHTGDSIVVSPTQTLADREYQMMRDSALKIIRALKIEGGVNIQMALDPTSFHYYIIEVNPRVSRSSALASKATGYPIAKMAAKIATGLTLDEIKNPITKTTWAVFEPALDYVVTKIPRFPFDKFKTADRTLGTQMKATGEVMAIGRSFEESLQKAVRSLEVDQKDLLGERLDNRTDEELLAELMPAKEDRLFLLTELIRRGKSIESLHAITKIDLFYLDKLAHIVEIEQAFLAKPTDRTLLEKAKIYGFSDATLAKFAGKSEEQMRAERLAADICPVYKMVDTAAGEFESKTPYYYATYEEENESVKTKRPSVLVLGSGPIRIGQGVEFDYATVHAVKALQAVGYEAIIQNSNPETVSTDFAISDKLYFEPLTLEDVLNVIDLEQPIGVLVQFGGQTAINLAEGLAKAGVKILGTDLAMIDQAEDRDRFNQVMQELDLIQAEGASASTVEEARAAAEKIGYPLLIRPSYVIGGRGMEVLDKPAELERYMTEAVKVSRDHPVLLDSYLTGQEAELDLIADGQDVLIPGIMEHVERAGIHSGDSMAVYPPQQLSFAIQSKMILAATKLARHLKVVGLMNVQFVIHENEPYVIEVNPRASRTVPFLSKVTKVPMAQLATLVSLGHSLKSLGYCSGLAPEDQQVHVKAPVFSFEKLPEINQTLGPEMKSTGEAIGSGNTYLEALKKAFLSAKLPDLQTGSRIFLDLNPKEEALAKGALTELAQADCHFLAGGQTADWLSKEGFVVERIEGEAALRECFSSQQVDVVVDTNDLLAEEASEKEALRKLARDEGVAMLTAIDSFLAYCQTLTITVEEMESQALGE
ncbi:carbamoyl-phosphate synthase large subunit [Fructobacillus papyrifericola]|uniref:Carbamoyl phosphate synthase large chain n=1 Tax=Fructobacillus papyrifericola TaxID=2713172 RepID=A0ABS5QRW9_9LACO|nr:carbamoyl-phosphate synthase large subunit [Fructobacillus papyrifericola]MBS9335677.1 carbamoyl-phosphate synthase large subunit [Fructobacillus papyrifericola]